MALYIDGKKVVNSLVIDGNAYDKAVILDHSETTTAWVSSLVYNSVNALEYEALCFKGTDQGNAFSVYYNIADLPIAVNPPSSEDYTQFSQNGYLYVDANGVLYFCVSTGKTLVLTSIIVYKASDNSGSGNAFIPISWENETHNVQQNRTITVDGYNLNAPISQQNYSVGVLSMPITMPEGTNGLLFCYDLVGASYTDGDYYATIFCSDSQITNITDKTSSYGNKALVQQALSSGESVTGLIECLNIPSNSFYFNIQFGVSNFENIRLYALKV